MAGKRDDIVKALEPTKFEICANCRWKDTQAPPGGGFVHVCRVRGPSVVVVPMQTPQGVMAVPQAVWPTVTFEDWCGAFEAKPW